MQGSVTETAEEQSFKHNIGSFRRRQIGNSAMAVAASLPASARGSSKGNSMIPPVVARRIISCFSSLCKASPRVAFSMLLRAEDCESSMSCFDKVCSTLSHVYVSLRPLEVLICLTAIRPPRDGSILAECL